MVVNQQIYDTLFSLPDAPLILNQLQTALAVEQARRQQFYNDITEQEKVEFINGEVITHSPVRIEHNKVSLYLSQLMNVYVLQHNLGYVGSEKIMICLTRNDYEPDIVYFNPSKSKQFKPQQVKFPAPDLIVEVLSNSTEKIDRTIKFRDYQAHKVQEYWLIDPIQQIVEQYLLQDDTYQLQMKSGNGRINSSAIKGFTIDIKAIFDPTTHLQALKEIMEG